MWIPFSKATQNEEERIELCWYVGAMLYLTNFWWFLRLVYNRVRKLVRQVYTESGTGCCCDSLNFGGQNFFCGSFIHCFFMSSLWLKKQPPVWWFFYWQNDGWRFYWQNDGWCFWRRRCLLPPQDYFLSQWRSITQIYNLSLDFHIILFWELLLRNEKISSKSLFWNEWVQRADRRWSTAKSLYKHLKQV